MMDLSPADSKDSRKRARDGVEAEPDSPPKAIKRQKMSTVSERRSLAGRYICMLEITHYLPIFCKVSNFKRQTN